MNGNRRWYSTLRRNAEANISAASAASYRESDDAARDSDSHAGKCAIIRKLSEGFRNPIDVVDLGCGTGRYFHCVTNVRSLVGVDPSEHMLRQARKPVLGGTDHVRLIRSSVHEVVFLRGTFDLAVCVGVLSLWCPLDEYVMQRIAGMLRQQGVFFFTVVEYEPVQMTLKRRLATAVRPLLCGAPRRYVETRLRDFTVSEPDVRTLGEKYFHKVSITRWRSPTARVDLHCVLSEPRTQAITA